MDIVFSENDCSADLDRITSDADHKDELSLYCNRKKACRFIMLATQLFWLTLSMIENGAKIPIRNRRDLSRTYTPGVARVCEAIAEDGRKANDLTIKGNTVAVVSDENAAGLGNIDQSRCPYLKVCLII